MRIVLWILQVLLAALFAQHGWQYAATPPADMTNTMLAPGFRTFIGVAELLAAVGLIVPSATRILPWLTPLAAAGLMIVMAGATVVNFSEGDTPIGPVILFVLVTFVAYMRWKVYPIAPRNATPVPA
jgi:uncharacterized membrane protein YphA (DoxX/SURF4 family)